MQATTFIKIFIKAYRLFPFLKSSTVSKLKAEKVLNPPHSPITRSDVKLLLELIFSPKTPRNKARRMQLKTFETKVAIGKND